MREPEDVRGVLSFKYRYLCTALDTNIFPMRISK